MANRKKRTKEEEIACSEEIAKKGRERGERREWRTRNRRKKVRKNRKRKK